LQFANDCNEKCLTLLGNPTTTNTYQRVLKVLESTDRIPMVSVYGYTDTIDAACTGSTCNREHKQDTDDNDTILMNFWIDT
jgi:hypothetical protein